LLSSRAFSVWSNKNKSKIFSGTKKTTKKNLGLMRYKKYFLVVCNLSINKIGVKNKLKKEIELV